ncbi:hypothetical protein IMSAGC020_00944 [Lachnospiraceae bacterium]|nr:hypothetical protein IMSAGC020_00944 [Lachnospiraceae bacterium]
MGGIGNTMDKRQADINSRIEMAADNTSDTDFEQKQSDSFRIKTETVTESDSQKSDVKTTSKDSVFRDLFGDRKYALQLYQAIHPEDTDVTEADIGNVTIKNIFTDQQYNDLGMTVRGKLLLMLEAQSSWTVNIIIRIFLYLAHTWNEYIESTRQNRYGSKKLAVPRPEFYVIYSGDRKDRPKWLRLSEEFFEGNKEYLEINVKVLYGDGKGDIISQYVDFTKVYNEQVRLYGKTREAVLSTIRICQDRNVLKEYLSGREKEVINIMMGLFDQEKAVEQFGNEKKEEGREEGKLESKKEAAINMKAEGLPESMIAKVLDVGLNIVQEWVAGTAVAR